MRSGKSTCSVAILALCATLSGQAAKAQAPASPKLAEDVFMNIQALKGTPADQLIPAMQFMSASLGVDCEFCHVEGKFESDEKKEKKTARDMIAMTLAINKTHFNGHREISCNSCHNGAEHPKGVPPVAQTDMVEQHAERHGPPPGQTQDAGAILTRYLTAVGGADALEKVTSRVEKGKLVAGGRETPVEITSKAPYKRIYVAHMPNGDMTTAFDGVTGWLGYPGRHPRDMSAGEADGAKLDADMSLALHLKDSFSQFRVGRPEKIGDTQCVSLIAIRKDMPPVRLWFDEGSGLLVRMVRYADTPVGRNPTQVDYADYQAADGVKVPRKVTIARPSGRFTIQVSDVRQNVNVDDAAFAKPAAPSK